MIDDVTESLKVCIKRWGSFPFQFVSFKDEGIERFIFLFRMLIEIGSATGS